MTSIEVSTNWKQRTFLLVMALVATGINWALRHDVVGLWIVTPLTMFIWVVLIMNWKMTVIGPREWHDYR